MKNLGRDETAVDRCGHESRFGAGEFEPSGDEVLDVAAKHGLSAYDAQFVVTAIQLEVPLVTFDARLAAACPEVAIPAERFIRP